MLIVFDVDGTLIGGETFDWASFDVSLERIAGLVLSQEWWDKIEEVTARAIVHTALAASKPLEEIQRLEQLVQQGYLDGLSEAYRAHPEAFRPTPGAPALLEFLRARRADGVDVAIATGDWQPTISFKLQAAGLDIDGIPIATCSDCHSRADIIALAAARAGRSVQEAIYVGDGVWDFRATQKLGIPFIGTGSRPEPLRAAGAPYVLPDLTPEPFWATLQQITARQARQVTSLQQLHGYKGFPAHFFTHVTL